ncbi:hypothetical protein PMIN03_006486 [Paraphaeosphaeria minitans]
METPSPFLFPIFHGKPQQSKHTRLTNPPSSKHGTFRPTLLALVQSNPASSVTNATRSAFSSSSSSSSSPSPPTLTAQLKSLTSLRGIGPATGSLLLSVAHPSTHPFFSDELYRWLAWDRPGQGGWKRGIKYTVKECEEVADRFGELRARLGVQAVEAERVAWVLGRRGVDLDEGGGEWLEGLGEEGVVEKGGVAGGSPLGKGGKRKAAGCDEDGDGDGVGDGEIGAERKKAKTGVKRKDSGGQDGEKDAAKKAKTGMKRKAEGTDVPAEGVRRSIRKKAAS